MARKQGKIRRKCLRRLPHPPPPDDFLLHTGLFPEILKRLDWKELYKQKQLSKSMGPEIDAAARLKSEPAGPTAPVIFKEGMPWGQIAKTMPPQTLSALLSALDVPERLPNSYWELSGPKIRKGTQQYRPSRAYIERSYSLEPSEGSLLNDQPIGNTNCFEYDFQTGKKLQEFETSTDANAGRRRQFLHYHRDFDNMYYENFGRFGGFTKRDVWDPTDKGPPGAPIIRGLLEDGKSVPEDAELEDMLKLEHDSLEKRMEEHLKQALSSKPPTDKH